MRREMNEQTRWIVGALIAIGVALSGQMACLQNQIAVVDSRVTETSGTSGLLRERVRDVELGLGSSDSRISSVNTSLGGVLARLGTVEGAVDGAQLALRAVESSLNAVDRDVRETQGDLERLAEHVLRVDEGVGGVAASVASLAANADSVNVTLLLLTQCLAASEPGVRPAVLVQDRAADPCVAARDRALAAVP